MIFVACLPIAIAGLLPRSIQEKLRSFYRYRSQESRSSSVKPCFPAMVETYAILALLISILAVSGIQFDSSEGQSMTGLEKMVSQILEEADTSAAVTISDGEKATRDPQGSRRKGR